MSLSAAVLANTLKDSVTNQLSTYSDQNPNNFFPTLISVLNSHLTEGYALQAGPYVGVKPDTTPSVSKGSLTFEATFKIDGDRLQNAMAGLSPSVEAEKAVAMNTLAKNIFIGSSNINDTKVKKTDTTNVVTMQQLITVQSLYQNTNFDSLPGESIVFNQANMTTVDGFYNEFASKIVDAITGVIAGIVGVTVPGQDTGGGFGPITFIKQE